MSVVWWAGVESRQSKGARLVGRCLRRPREEKSLQDMSARKGQLWYDSSGSGSASEDVWVILPECRNLACRFEREASNCRPCIYDLIMGGPHKPGPRNLAAVEMLVREAGAVIEGRRARRVRRPEDSPAPLTRARS